MKDDTEKPLVSVIVPCFNAEPWVAAAMDSALAQTWPEIEIIAVDDGSTDRSLSVLGRYAGPRVRVLDQANRGAAAARNAGLAAASGDFIQFLDADDLLEPTKIANQVGLLIASGPGAVGISRWARFRNDPSDAVASESALFCDLSPVDFLLLHTARGEMMHPAAWLVPRSVAEKAGPWDESLSLNDDGEYFARIALASRKIVFSPGSLSLYRSGLAGSLSGRRDRKSLISLLKSCELIADHLTAAEDSPRVRQALADYFQRLVYETYPDAPNLSKEAETRVRGLGGSQLKPLMGRRQAMLARFVGWKLVRRAARLLGR